MIDTLTQLSLSPSTIQNLHLVDPNASRAVEWLVRAYLGGSFDAPYIVQDRSAKIVVNVNLSPYTIQALCGFGEIGMSSSQVVEWLAKVYIDSQKVANQPIEQPPKPKVPKVKQPKQPKQKAKQRTLREKPAFVHSSDSGPVVKKVKVKPVKR